MNVTLIPSREARSDGENDQQQPQAHNRPDKTGLFLRLHICQQRHNASQRPPEGSQSVSALKWYGMTLRTCKSLYSLLRAFVNVLFIVRSCRLEADRGIYLLIAYCYIQLDCRNGRRRRIISIDRFMSLNKKHSFNACPIVSSRKLRRFCFCFICQAGQNKPVTGIK